MKDTKGREASCEDRLPEHLKSREEKFAQHFMSAPPEPEDRTAVLAYIDAACDDFGYELPEGNDGVAAIVQMLRDAPSDAELSEITVPDANETYGGQDLHALSSAGTFPPDVYDHPEWYSWPPFIEAAAQAIRVFRDRPAGAVRVYRAAPPGVDTLHSGDWVTTVLAYARQHAVQSEFPDEDWPIYLATVRADQVRSGGSDLLEWGYYGPDVPLILVPESD